MDCVQSSMCLICKSSSHKKSACPYACTNCGDDHLTRLCFTISKQPTRTQESDFYSRQPTPRTQESEFYSRQPTPRTQESEFYDQQAKLLQFYEERQKQKIADSVFGKVVAQPQYVFKQQQQQQQQRPQQPQSMWDQEPQKPVALQQQPQQLQSIWDQEPQKHVALQPQQLQSIWDQEPQKPVVPQQRPLLSIWDQEPQKPVALQPQQPPSMWDQEPQKPVALQPQQLQSIWDQEPQKPVALQQRPQLPPLILQPDSSISLDYILREEYDTLTKEFMDLLIAKKNQDYELEEMRRLLSQKIDHTS